MLYGVLPEKVDLRDYKVCSANIDVEYPEEFLLENLPKVKDQGRVNSCCPHATSSILEYHDGNKTDLSTNFFYGIQKKLCCQLGEGMYLADACKIAKSYGDMTEKDCPGNTEVPECRKVAEASFADYKKRATAKKYKIKSYYSCKSSNDIKYALMNYGPVLCSVYWRERYIVEKDGTVIFNENTMGGLHAIMVVGWNQKGWVFQNSWGTSFAQKGRGIIPFEHGIREAKVLVDETDESSESDAALVVPANNTRLSDMFYKLVNLILNAFNKSSKSCIK